MKKAIHSHHAFPVIGPYSQAIISENLVFISGQIALDPQTQELVSSDIAMQTTKIMQNISAILEGAGLTLNNILRTEIYLANMNDFLIVNKVYGQFFNDISPKPARITIQAAALPKGAKIEISAIAGL